jgi:hypothetical protein
MASSHGFRFGFGVGLLLLFGAAAAEAQAPPYPPGPPGAAPPDEAAQIAGCLCEERQIAALSAEVQAKKNSLDELQRRLADLDAELARARPQVDVNNPDSVERYKALLERRDRVFQRSTGPIVADTTAAVNRYNAQVNAYNQRCAHQLFDAALMAQIRATLSCPGPR